MIAKSTPVLLYTRLDAGHRLAFVEFFASLLPGRRAAASELFLAEGPVLFLMIEEAFALYTIVALFRAGIGRKTVGFLFRPGPAVDGTSTRLRIKRAVLKMLLRISSCTTLTILPFSAQPRFAEIADGWIDDPQQWDLSDDDLAAVAQLRQSPRGLTQEVRESAGERRVVAALGRLDRDKGFDQMVATGLAKEGMQEWQFAAGGKVSAASLIAARDFLAAGGLLFDRQLTDGEILELYAGADLIWCCYSKDYDQSSGILGRAGQLGIPAIVRRGSLLQRICEEGGIEHLAFDPDNPQPLAPRPLDPNKGREMRDRMRARSLGVLRAALSTGAAVN